MSPALGCCAGSPCRQQQLLGWDAWHGDAVGWVAVGTGAPRGWRGHGELRGRSVHGDTAPRAGDKHGACLPPPLPLPSLPLAINLCSASMAIAGSMRDGSGGTSAPSTGGVCTPCPGVPAAACPPPHHTCPSLVLPHPKSTARGCSVHWRPGGHPWRTQRA